MVWPVFGDFSVAATLGISVLTCWILRSLLTRQKNTPPGPWGIPVLGSLPQVTVGAASVGIRKLFHDWYLRYGAVFHVKMGSANVVVLNDFQCIKDALVHPEIQDRIKLDYTIGRPGDGLIASSGQVWRQQRKFVHNHFREFGIGKASFEERVVAEADFLTEALLKFEGKSIDFGHIVNNAASNVVSAVSFGQRFNYNDELFQNVLQKINDTMETGMVKMALSVFLPFMKQLPVGDGKRVSENTQVVFNFHSEKKEQHEAKLDENDIRDVMDAYLLEMKQRTGSEIFDDKNMFWTIIDLLVAGTETTTTTLRWVFLFLLNNPDIETKLRLQLESVVGRNRLPRYSDRQNLPYLEAVISESLRLGTVCSLSLPHVTSSDVTFYGYHIPKGTIMIPNFHALFTEASKWKEPERFWPERFLDEDGRYIKREDFIPFSTGRRLCIGESLARMELFIFITHIMQKMKFSVPEGQEMPTLEGIEGFTYQPKPYEVFITKCGM